MTNERRVDISAVLNDFNDRLGTLNISLLNTAEISGKNKTMLEAHIRDEPKQSKAIYEAIEKTNKSVECLKESIDDIAKANKKTDEKLDKLTSGLEPYFNIKTTGSVLVKSVPYLVAITFTIGFIIMLWTDYISPSFMMILKKIGLS